MKWQRLLALFLLALTLFIMGYVVPVKADTWIDPYEQDCLAMNIYHEARGESYAGMVAVAWTTMHRVASPRFPDTICEVVQQGEHRVNWKGNTVPVLNRCQFSWYCDGRSDQALNKNSWRASLIVAQRVLQGKIPDNTQGATHYYNPAKASPYWRTAYIQKVKVGSHLFLGEE